MEAIQVMGSYAVSEQNTAELYSRWVNFIEGSPKTIETYSKAVRVFIHYLEDRAITQPTREDVRSYRELLKNEGKSPATIQSYIISLKQFFKWTEEEGLYPNIAKNVKGAKIDNSFKKDYLVPAQIKNLLGVVDRTTAQGRRDYAILTLMLTTGLRDVEVVRANIEDLKPVANFMALFIQGKGHHEKAQYVKVSAEVEKAIRESLADRENTQGSEPLFISLANRNLGERLTTRSVSRVVKTHLREAGLNSDRLTAHSLRHTTATLNLLNGGTVEETQQLLRHTNINTTLIYSHALERANNNSEDRVAQAIFS